jgi:hypothetical protein
MMMVAVVVVVVVVVVMNLLDCFRRRTNCSAVHH